MGKRKGGAPKRKSELAAEAPADVAEEVEDLPKRKKSKKQTDAAAETLQPKQQPSKQKESKAKAGKKSLKKDKQQPADQPKPRKGRGKKQQQQQQEDDDELEQEEAEQEQEDPEKSVHDTFMEEVLAKEKELQKHCLIMDQVETDEDETTLEQLRELTRVFVPQQVQEDFMELWEQLDEVGEDSEGEEDEGEEGNEDQDDQPDILGAIMKAILGGKMLNTKHSSQMHTIFKAHQDKIDKAIKSKSWQEAFCRWAATLMASHREKHWYEDTDEPEEAEAIYSKMRKQWLKLKARSDKELGGLVAEGDKSAKDEFDHYLQAVADDMKTMDYEVQDV